MVTDKPYRQGMLIPQALEELQACAGTQFDPSLVERFVAIVESGASTRGEASTERYSVGVDLQIGEQVETLVEAADSGDGPTFLALAQRLKQTAEQNQIESIAAAASHALAVVDEDAQLKNMVEEAFQLLEACRSMRDAGIRTTPKTTA